MKPDEYSSGAGFLMVLAAFALLLQIALLALAPGCGHAPPIPPAPPPFKAALARCEGFVDPTDIDVCDGKFTPEGLACVRCNVSIGCLHAQDSVYCTPSCSDPYCGSEP